MDKPSNSREDNVLALEKALARPVPPSSIPEATPAPSTHSSLSDQDPVSDYPIWVGKSAMLPGYWDILGVHEASLVAMVEMLLEGNQPHFYVHVSQSSSFPPKPSSSVKPGGAGMDPERPLMLIGNQEDDPRPQSLGTGAISDDEDSWLHPSFDHDRPALGTLMEVMVVDRALGGRRLFLAVRAIAR